MRRIFYMTLIALVAVSCGYNPEKKAYDTTGNPDKFPDRALKLVDGIESGSLNTFDTITATFADLYTNHPELLDDTQWRAVIQRLGSKFKFKAEQYTSEGPARFLNAARFYTLAAFARPDDARLQGRKALFDTWEKAVLDSIVPANFDPDNKSLAIGDQLAVLKYFMLTDSLHSQFGRDYLLPHVLDVRTANAMLKGGGQGNLAASDACFLLTLGFKGHVPSIPLASFTEPRVDLVSMRISRQTGNWYSAEFYFVPHERLMENYHVAFRLAGKDSTGAGVRQIPFDFNPEQPATSWKPGVVAAAYRRFLYEGSPVEPMVGLYVRSADSTHFVPLRDSGAPLFTGTPSLFTVR